MSKATEILYNLIEKALVSSLQRPVGYFVTSLPTKDRKILQELKSEEIKNIRADYL